MSIHCRFIPFPQEIVFLLKSCINGISLKWGPKTLYCQRTFSWS